MEPAITLRQARGTDVETIVELYGVLFHEDGRLRDRTLSPTWATSEGATYFHNVVTGPNSACWLAEQDHTAVGYLIGRLQSASSFRPTFGAELESMVVQPGWRRYGVGRRLVQAFVAWAKQHQATHLQVTAYATNADAIAFYQRLGFTPHQVTLEQLVEL